MFHLSRLPGHRRSSGGPRHKDDAPGVRLLVITADFEYYTRLSQAATAAGWSIRAASTVEEAIPHVQSGAFPLIVYDGDANGDWRGAFDRIRSVSSSVCLVLASLVTDPYLWEEVIQRGGFDVIPRLAAREELINKLRFAWFWNETLRPASNRRTGGVCERARYSNDDASH